MNLSLTHIVVAILMAVFTLTSTHSAVTGFYYEAGPNGSYISQGDGLIFPEDGWTFTLGTKLYNGSEAVGFKIIDSAGDKWHIRLAMPDTNKKLEIGNYLATRTLNQEPGTAGFDWSGFSRGLNTLDAYFEIYEIEYSTDNTIHTIAFDFIQVEETGFLIREPDLEIDRWSYGSYRLNSNIPIGVPEPGSVMLAMAGGFVLSLRRRRK